METTTTTLSAPTHSSRALNIGLWIGQVLLASMFGFSGFMKSTQPITALAEMMIWPGTVPEALVRFIGVSELLGALGLILPAATRIQPRLTALAGAGLAVVMLLALPFHVVRGEFSAVPVVVVIGALAAFVAWGRGWKREPADG